MKRRWLDSGLVAVAALSLVGFVRALMVLSPPAAADLPEPLRREGPKLAGYRTIPEPTKPPGRDRDLAWGPTYRYRLVPLEGPTQQSQRPPLLLDLVVQRHRKWYAMALPTLPASLKVLLSPDVQVMIGTVGNRRALQTCLVGPGQDGEQPTAAVDQAELQTAISRWNDRHDSATSKRVQLQKTIAIQAGLRVNQRWECLLVNLQLEADPKIDPENSRKQLLAAWNQLRPALGGWGEQWDGAGY
jgi:hypothetical protein